MQNTFQLAGSFKKSVIILAFTWLFGLTAQAEPLVSQPVINQKSRVRLVSASVPSPLKFYRAGIEIELAPAAITYWRTPGDAGVPPIFSFAGSQNLARAEVFFPAPQRLENAGETSFGYQTQVIFPLHIIPVEAEKPVLLKLHLNYAVCDRICLPETADLAFAFEPGPIIPVLRQDALERAEKSIPQSLSPRQIEAWVELEPVKSAAGEPSTQTWRLLWKGEAPKDIFAEAPEGWYFNIEKTSDPKAFLLSATEHPPMDQTQDPNVTFTIVLPEQSFEFELVL